MNRTNIILILSFLTTLHIHTMDEPMSIERNESPQKLICYFAKLDPNIWDLIAQYLTFYDMESEEEFIARTKILKIKKSIPSKYSHHLISHQERCFPGLERGWHVSKTLIAHCPNKTNIAFLRFLHAGNSLMPELIVIDERKNIVKNRISLSNIRDNIFRVALSRHSQMFATVSQVLEIPFKDLENFDTFKAYPFKQNLLIQEIPTQKIILDMDCDLSESPTDLIIAFNKQGTHIIVHSTDCTQTENLSTKDIKKDPVPGYMIFPLTMNEQNAIAPKKTLQHYFHQEGICKSIISSLDK